MNRRDFLVAASGVTGAGAATAAVTPVAGQEDETGDDSGTAEEGGDSGGGGDGDGNETGEDGSGNETDGGGEGGGGGGVEEVAVVDNEFQPDSLTIEPGTTVRWVWEGDGHNVHATETPEESDWEGHLQLEDAGFEYEHTFDVEGEYHYVCDPHVGLGMEGEIVVDPEGGGGGAEAEVDVHDVGVPIQKHFVGIATFLAIFVSLVFTFYLLKYGESANTSSPGRK